MGAVAVVYSLVSRWGPPGDWACGKPRIKPGSQLCESVLVRGQGRGCPSGRVLYVNGGGRVRGRGLGI